MRDESPGSDPEPSDDPAMTQRLSRSRSQTYLKLKACASCTNTIAARCLQTE